MGVPASPSSASVGRISPLKRKRSPSPSPSPSVPPRLSPPVLLLSLPKLLVLPPTHPYHVSSLRLSLLAVRRCLQLRDRGGPGMTPELECRAWTSFVELGMKIVGAGLSGRGPESEHWARGLENEIGIAIGKGLVHSQKHPSLRYYTHHLTLLHSNLAQWQHNHKFARTLLRRHIASLSSSDPPLHHYSTHLTLVAHALASNPVDLPAALHSLAAVEALANSLGHPDAALLAQVIKLRAFVSALNWAEVFPLLDALESALGLIFPEVKPKSESGAVPVPPPAPSSPSSALYASLELHILALSVLAHVHAGRSADASKRITRLHAALDSGILDQEGIREGVIEVALGTSGVQAPPLLIHTTHPRVFFHLAFLVSAVAMRDTTGRRPKPKVFATEGLAVCERERPKRGQRVVGRYLPWAGLREHQDVEERLAKIEADLLCEFIGVGASTLLRLTLTELSSQVCIQRSEFDEAEQHLAKLIAHTRSHAIWDAYSARVTLHYAHLAHSLCRRDRAIECYRAAAHLAGNEERGAAAGSGGASIAVARFVRVAAQAGEVGLRIGMARLQTLGDGVDEGLKKRGAEVAKECRMLGGTLEAVGRVLEACLTDEIVVAKRHLKASLDLTTHALDNHLRALVLALTSSHYLHTSPEYAEMMLTTARQLAAGLGAPASKAQDPQLRPKASQLKQQYQHQPPPPRRVGNAPLGMWVGQRFLELYRRMGRDVHATRQSAINEQLANAVEEIEKRGQF